QDLESIHQLFKKHILDYIPSLDIDKVATGDYWFGKDALELGLVDKIQTKDDYLIDLLKKQHNVYDVSCVIKKDTGFLRS
ncbi:S49 family peptidase, partial [Francisella tularensis subsp. holarctica]|uniref:S49 family peptidase n=1 Tax=Francisella tularensis TaxID=263 RepID=UPI002381C918